MKGSDTAHAIIAEFCTRVLGAIVAARLLCGARAISRTKTPLCLGVLRVLFRRAPEQMCRIHAKPVVAMVTSEFAVRGGAVCKHQRPAMSRRLDAMPVAPGNKEPIAFGSGSGPRPTSIGARRAIHERPETIFSVIGKVLRSARATTEFCLPFRNNAGLDKKRLATLGALLFDRHDSSRNRATPSGRWDPCRGSAHTIGGHKNRVLTWAPLPRQAQYSTHERVAQ